MDVEPITIVDAVLVAGPTGPVLHVVQHEDRNALSLPGVETRVVSAEVVDGVMRARIGVFRAPRAH